MAALTYGAWSRRELGLSPGLPPSLTLSTVLSALVECPGSGALLGWGAEPECSNKVPIFFYPYLFS
jgi:hypothetical protein